MNQNSISVATTNVTSTATSVNEPNPMPLDIDENNVSKTVALSCFSVEDEGAGKEESNAASQTVETVDGIKWVRASIHNYLLKGNTPV